MKTKLFQFFKFIKLWFWMKSKGMNLFFVELKLGSFWAVAYNIGEDTWWLSTGKTRLQALEEARMFWPSWEREKNKS